MSITDPQPIRTVDTERSRRALVVCDQWLGSNGYAGMKALRRAGWGVHVVPEWEYVPVRWASWPMRALARSIRGLAVREFNDTLLRAADISLPEMLLVFKGTFVRADTLRALRARGVRTVCFYPDVSTRTHGPFLPKALPIYNLVFTTKRFGRADLTALGVTDPIVVNHAFDPDLHRPLTLTADDRRRYGCDVSFIGTWSPKKERTVVSLRRGLPDVPIRVWGAQWDRATAPELTSVIAGHTVEGEEYVRAICASKINLALLSERRVGASGGDQVTSRTFHIPAAGGFMLHERTGELLELFGENREVACFEGEQELIDRVRHWLAHPDDRSRIADAGRAAVHNAHSWDRRIAEILEAYEQRVGSNT